jgi:peptidyl-dipeptidase A
MCLKHDDELNYWIWEAWRVAVGPKIKEFYPHLVELMSEAARKDDYKDIGDLWQSEMELGGDVEGLMSELMGEIQPLYNMLQAFVKSVLAKHHKQSPGRDLPAHLLGWNSNWFHLFKQYVEPEFFKTSDWSMDEALKKADWDQNQLLKRVEDFYTAMGLPRMTTSFWNKSVINDEQSLSCHGTAADMYAPDDFRMIVCGCKNLYDFYVIIHEMGHIEQYLLAQNQPAVFRAGNSIVQETIGDTAFLAMMTPTHLNRLRLIGDAKLFPSSNNDFDLHQLMMMAFMRLPEIPFGYVFEKFRYDLFAERVGVEQANDYYWDLTRKYQRVEPPNLALNRHDLFDAAAKFHLAANIPYARYFFANVLQYQVFRALCEKTFYAKLNTNQTLPLPLHKCDIYGSKRAGNLLK